MAESTPLPYRPYAGLPPLAGIGTFEEAMHPGLSIDDCVSRLKRHHWAFRRLHEIMLTRLTAEPIYELKMAFSLHAHYCAEHAAAWRERVGEMREPPLRLDDVPHAGLEVFFDEIKAAPDTLSLLTGIYGVALPALRDALQRHLEDTNPLVDHPTVRRCRFALLEVDEMIAYGSASIASLTAVAPAESQPGGREDWVRLLESMLESAGGLDGIGDTTGAVPAARYSASPPAPDWVPQRDERFVDPCNMGVHAEAFLYNENLPVEAKPLMLYYKRLREIDVPEMMASIIAETKGKPWAYTVDMTRQLWDESRHAMMGEVGFVRAGIDWSRLVRINKTWSLALNTQLTPIERHAVLYFIEQGLMPKTGKRFEWETGIASGDEYAAMIQDYDWADEVLHARIGRDWYVKDRESPQEAVTFGDACWSKVLIDWERYRADGVTEHANWWPGLYQEWCDIHGKTPDPAALAFNTSYATARADLKDISAAG